MAAQLKSLSSCSEENCDQPIGSADAPLASLSMRRESERYQMLLAMQEALGNARGSLDAILGIVAEQAMTVAGGSGAVVELVEGDELVYRVACGSLEHTCGMRLKIEGSLSGLSVRQGRTLHSDDTATDSRVDRAACRILNVSSMIVVPLHSGGEAIGVLKVASERPFTFDLGDIAVLQLTAGMITAAIKGVTDRERQHEVEALNARLQQAMTETHHRVKNNLQILTAMIDMQVLDHDSLVPVEELRRLNVHIRALAAVHDLLTGEAKRDGQAHSFSARLLLHKLLPMMQQTAPQHPIRYVIDDARLTARQGTSLAIVVNELVSNALKHGKGAVEVALRAAPDALRLEVRDDGPGFPPDFNSTVAANTGLSLVDNLAAWDLNGTIRYENRQDRAGARVLITMPLPTGE